MGIYTKWKVKRKYEKEMKAEAKRKGREAYLAERSIVLEKRAVERARAKARRENGTFGGVLRGSGKALVQYAKKGKGKKRNWKDLSKPIDLNIKI